MTPNDYLSQILKSQQLKSDGDDLAALQSARADVEDALRAGFPDCAPSIRYGGSKAKGTMILDDYDLDVICYFPHDDTSAGGSLEDIYNNVRSCFEKDYAIHPRTTALRLHDKDGGDFHIDVVPGRFTDTTKTDAYLHQNGGSKKFLKTNIQTHIDHVSKSGCTDIIQLMKLWRLRNGVSIRTFPMELLVIEVLKDTKAQGLEGRLTELLLEVRDNIDDYSIEDPGNPTGNDLSELLNDTVRASLSAGAWSTLQTVETSGWEAVFGAVETTAKVHKVAALSAAAVHAPSPTRPWSIAL